MKEMPVLETDSDGRGGLSALPPGVEGVRGTAAFLLAEYRTLPKLPPRVEPTSADRPAAIEPEPVEPADKVFHCAKQYVAAQQEGPERGSWYGARLGAATEVGGGQWTVSVRTKLPGIGRGPIGTDDDCVPAGQLHVDMTEGAAKVVRFERAL